MANGAAGRAGCFLFAFILLCAGAALGILGYFCLTPYRNSSMPKFVEIEHGKSSRAIAEQLKAQGLVRSPWLFLAVRLAHPRAALQAGEYQLSAAQTPWEIFDKIRRGEIFYEEMTVPEGSNIFDIAALLSHSDTVDSNEFLKAAADAASIHDLDLSAPSLEGYLFPSTYRLTHRTTGRQLCHAMTTEFRKEWAALQAPGQRADVHRVVTLASLVEKETAVKAERPEVAAVFTNRLRLQMPLQCDPTTVYAALLENRYRGVIHRSDLASTSPYNTYAHQGLPPGPIANPGRLSLQAALHPADSPVLYFVAKPGNVGSHVFSSTLAEHERAVQAYRKGAR